MFNDRQVANFQQIESEAHYFEEKGDCRAIFLLGLDFCSPRPVTCAIGENTLDLGSRG